MISTKFAAGYVFAPTWTGVVGFGMVDFFGHPYDLIGGIAIIVVLCVAFLHVVDLVIPKD